MMVAFTGSRDGISKNQNSLLIDFIANKPGDVSLFSHGCCVGADIVFHNLVRSLLPFRGHGSARIYAYPSSKLQYDFAALNKADFEEIRHIDDVDERDKKLVDDCEILIACPYSLEFHPKSGVWRNILYGQNSGKKVIVLGR